MPGTRSDSEAGWTALTLREQGGVAAVRRGCTVQRAELPAAVRDRLDAQLAGLPDPPAAMRDVLPDAQQLVVDVVRGANEQTRVYDRADLPAEVADLLRLVRGMSPFSAM